MLSLRNRELTQQWAGTDEEFQSLVTQLRALLSVAHNDDGSLIEQAPPAAAAVGQVVAYAGLTIPPGWLPCNGTAVSRTTYQLLFKAIGTAHGAGDGVTTFNLPFVAPLGTLPYLILAV